MLISTGCNFLNSALHCYVNCELTILYYVVIWEDVWRRESGRKVLKVKRTYSIGKQCLHGLHTLLIDTIFHWQAVSLIAKAVRTCRIGIHVRTCMHARMHTHTCTHPPTPAHAYMYARMHACTHTHTHTHTSPHTHMPTHARTCTHTRPPRHTHIGTHTHTRMHTPAPPPPQSRMHIHPPPVTQTSTNSCIYSPRPLLPLGRRDFSRKLYACLQPVWRLLHLRPWSSISLTD